MICNNDFLKNCKGQLGDELIVTSYNGKTYLRRKPKSIRMTTAMMEQGERISSVAALWQAMKTAGLDQAWQQAAKGSRWTAYNVMVKNCLCAFNGKGVISDFEKLKLTIGTLQLTDHLSAKNEDNRIEIGWDGNSGVYPGSKSSDIFVIACLKRADNFTLRIPDIDIFRRKDGHAFLRPEILPEDFPYLYCYFRSEDGRKFSESKFLLNFN